MFTRCGTFLPLQAEVYAERALHIRPFQLIVQQILNANFEEEADSLK